MSIDFTWRRIPAVDLPGHDPAALRGLVPDLFDDDYDRLRAAGVVAGMGDDGALIGGLLAFGTEGTAGASAAATFAAGPADWDEELMVGTLDPAAVQQIAAVVGDAPWRRWLDDHFDALVAETAEAGFAAAVEEAAHEGPWADHLLLNAGELSTVFHLAATHGEAVIFAISA